MCIYVTHTNKPCKTKNFYSGSQYCKKHWNYKSVQDILNTKNTNQVTTNNPVNNTVNNPNINPEIKNYGTNSNTKPKKIKIITKVNNDQKTEVKSPDNLSTEQNTNEPELKESEININPKSIIDSILKLSKEDGLGPTLEEEYPNVEEDDDLNLEDDEEPKEACVTYTPKNLFVNVYFGSLKLLEAKYPNFMKGYVEEQNNREDVLNAVLLAADQLCIDLGLNDMQIGPYSALFLFNMEMIIMRIIIHCDVSSIINNFYGHKKPENIPINTPMKFNDDLKNKINEAILEENIIPSKFDNL